MWTKRKHKAKIKKNTKKKKHFAKKCFYVSMPNSTSEGSLGFNFVGNHFYVLQDNLKQAELNICLIVSSYIQGSQIFIKGTKYS